MNKTRFRTIIPITFVFLGCCSNVIFLELLTKEDPGSGNIITFSQFVFIAIEGFIFTTKFGRNKPVVPLSHYVTLVVQFFMVNVSNNYALNFNISMPLHMIFRSGSLIANMVLGIIILKRRYKLSKYVGVGMITIGIATCTIASAKTMSSSNTVEEHWTDFLSWIFGLLLLTFALFLSARMGISQEILNAKYGNNSRESLFYSHALPLPGFLLLSKDIYNHAVVFSESEHLPWPILGSIPKLWVYLIGNVLTQYVCIRSVYMLTAECSSLSVTLVITLRKFVSLILSIFYFKNPFTLTHWAGTALVFAGTLLFVDIVNMVREMLEEEKAPLKKME